MRRIKNINNFELSMLKLLNWNRLIIRTRVCKMMIVSILMDYLLDSQVICILLTVEISQMKFF